MISGGGQRHPVSRWWLVVVLVAAVGAGGVWLAVRGGPTGAKAVVTPASSSSATTPTPPADLSDFQNSMSGVPLRAGPDMVLYLRRSDEQALGESLSTYHTRTRVVAPQSGITPRPGSPLVVIPLRDGLVVGYGWCADCGTRFGPLTVIASGTTRTVVDPGVVVANARGTGLWVQDGAPSGGPHTVHQVDLTMRSTTAPVTLPAGFTLDADTADGLLITSPTFGTTLWRDGQRGFTVGLQDPPLAVSPSALVFMAHDPADCAAHCRLYAMDLAGSLRAGRPSLPETIWPLPDIRARPDLCLALSPDGRKLAVCVADAATPDSAQGSRIGVDMIDLTTMRATPVPGVSTYPTEGQFSEFSLTWSQHSSWLALAAYDTAQHPGHTTIALWRPGLPQLQIAEIDAGKDTVAAAIPAS